MHTKHKKFNSPFFFLTRFQFSNFSPWTLADDWAIKTNSEIALNFQERLKLRAAYRKQKKKWNIFNTRSCCCLRRFQYFLHFPSCSNIRDRSRVNSFSERNLTTVDQKDECKDEIFEYSGIKQDWLNIYRDIKTPTEAALFACL